MTVAFPVRKVEPLSSIIAATVGSYRPVSVFKRRFFSGFEGSHIPLWFPHALVCWCASLVGVVAPRPRAGLRFGGVSSAIRDGRWGFRVARGGVACPRWRAALRLGAWGGPSGPPRRIFGPCAGPAEAGTPKTARAVFTAGAIGTAMAMPRHLFVGSGRLAGSLPGARLSASFEGVEASLSFAGAGVVVHQLNGVSGWILRSLKHVLFPFWLSE